MVNTETRPKPASDSLKQAVNDLVAQNKGRLYAQIPHPDFDNVPFGHKPKLRQDIIEPHLEYRGGTALEIGAYLAAFSHWLEGLGYDVTAVERNGPCVAVARQVRDLWDRKFQIIEGSFYDLPQLKYDVVLALSIFHHSLKRERTFHQLETFLGKLDCKLMFFEPHDPSKSHKHNEGAFRPMNPEEFAQFIASKTGLTDIQEIGKSGSRKLFKLRRP